jgi:predicted metal-dependent HD superfamily phosphohydrolase
MPHSLAKRHKKADRPLTCRLSDISQKRKLQQQKASVTIDFWHDATHDAAHRAHHGIHPAAVAGFRSHNRLLPSHLILNIYVLY